MKRRGNAVWNGSIKEGKGKITSQSRVLDNTQYSFKDRFEDGKGTNPDELLASAHAGCFAMALSLMLGEEGYTPESLDVSSDVSMDAGKLELTGSHLTLKAKVPGIDESTFIKVANQAKENCPVSKALSMPITLEASLEN